VAKANTEARVLPCPDVSVGADLLQRARTFAARLEVGGELREGGGRGAHLLGGEEFVGHRPYRAGEDLRRLDWPLLARLGQPFVKVTRREAGEEWAVLLDASASMGVGPPGKLQRACEVAGALGVLGVGRGARVRILASSGAELFLTRGRAGGELLSFLNGLRAEESAGMRSLVEKAAKFRAASRVFLVGDLLDLEPREALGLVRRGRTLAAVGLLAPLEFEPGQLGRVEWWDPEEEQRLVLNVGQESLQEYEASLGTHVDGWRDAAARHRAAFGCFNTRAPFEEVLRGVLGI
jgi:uncharacterized protein (DUF58 family)